MSTVRIGDEEYPVRFDFSAIKRTLPLFGLRYLAEVEKLQGMMGEEFPLEAICPFTQNVIISGLRYKGDSRQPPSLAEIEAFVDEDIANGFNLIMSVFEAIGEKPAGNPEDAKKPVKGKKKTPTPKR